MYYVQGITEDFRQSFQLTLDDGSVIDCFLQFFPNQLGWYLSFEYGDYKCSTPLRITNCPNFIRELQKRLPFGFGCSTTDGDEIMYVDDFTSGRAKLYLLDATDISEIEASIYGKVL